MILAHGLRGLRGNRRRRESGPGVGAFHDRRELTDARAAEPLQVSERLRGDVGRGLGARLCARAHIRAGIPLLLALRRFPVHSYNPHSMSFGRVIALCSAAAAAVLVLAWPTEAYAWGPLAHLSFSAQALQNLGAVQSPVRALLQDFGNEFLYGSLAADIVVGKNMARYLYHCHNWRVGFNVFKHARPGAEQAFALGFLGHLAADTVAHNYFVPFKTVAAFHKTSTKHAYWELRYDQRMDRGLSRVARQVSTRAIRGHDALLERTLGNSSVLPFGVSKQLFRSLLASARFTRFHHLSRLALARERRLVLEPDLVTETNDLSLSAILGFLDEGERCLAAHADATGARNIRLASDIRKLLQEQTRRHRITHADAAAIAAETRESFRKAIQGKLVLPYSLAKLAA